MISRNGQSRSQLTQKQPIISFNHQNLLNQMYDRVCNQQNTNQEYSNIKPLFSYLSISGQNSQVEEKAASPYLYQNVAPLSYQDQDCIPSLHYPKKYSIQQRVKTDMYQANSFTNQQYQNLKLENELLRRKLIKCEKKIIRLESCQSEVEYLKKISFIQHAEIEKLRIMLKNMKLEQVEKTSDNLRSIESQSRNLKDKNHNKNGAMISIQANTSVQNLQKKPTRCSHKQTLRRKDKQNQGVDRRHSVFLQTKNQKNIDKYTKVNSFQQKSSKLKNKKTTAKVD